MKSLFSFVSKKKKHSKGIPENTGKSILRIDKVVAACKVEIHSYGPPWSSQWLKVWPLPFFDYNTWSWHPDFRYRLPVHLKLLYKLSQHAPNSCTLHRPFHERTITFLSPLRGHLLQQWFQEWPHRVISFYSTGHSRWEEVSSTKLQFKDRENSTWLWVLDALGCSWMLFCTVGKGLLAHAWRMLWTGLFFNFFNF
jgi:hypothetical protein